MTMLETSRCLVTGANGFIATHLTAALAALGCDVHGIVRPDTVIPRLHRKAANIELHEVDLGRGDEVARAVAAIRPRFVFHLAVSRRGSDAQQRLQSVTTNVIGTSNLLVALAALPVRAFVHMGSSLEYCAGDDPRRESDPLEPDTHYGWTKAAATLLVRQRASAFGFPAVVLRAFYVYGFGEPDHRLIPSAIRAAFDGLELPLTASPCGRDFVFVDDVVDACLRAARAADRIRGEVINVATGRETRNDEVVALVEKLSGRPVRVQKGAFAARAWDDGRRIADIRKAHDLLGWAPEHSLEAGLARVLAWWSERRDRESASA